LSEQHKRAYLAFHPPHQFFETPYIPIKHNLFAIKNSVGWCVYIYLKQRWVSSNWNFIFYIRFIVVWCSLSWIICLHDNNLIRISYFWLFECFFFRFLFFLCGIVSEEKFFFYIYEIYTMSMELLGHAEKSWWNESFVERK
jgi:hypothetical protein